MRLSEKGCVHLNEWMVHKLPMDAFEFKPEDFTGAVVLTIYEAKIIMHHLLREKEFLLDSVGPMLAQYSQIWAEFLEGRIEQAEKKK